MLGFSKWIVLILLIGIVIFIIKIGTKIFNVLLIVIMLGFCWYSFFTESGAARLTIMLYGHPVIAYTTTLQKQDDLSTDREVYFTSSKPVIVEGKEKKYIKCGAFWIIRIPVLE